MSLTTHRRSDLTKYNPEKGLKTIAAAEVVEKRAAKAKDANALKHAIRVKLENQSEFALWWDTQVEKSKGAAQPQRRNGSVTALKAEDFGLDRMVISRWRRKLNSSPEAFEMSFKKACDRYIKILEFRTGATAGMSYPESNEWYTPAKYVEAARAVMGGIDLDPASSVVANAIVQAEMFYTAEDDGLKHEWAGRVWLNPPYSGNASAFVFLLAERFKAGHVLEAVLLVNSHGTDASWFQPLWNALLCFTDHRINFISPASGAESGSNHGSVFAYFGPHRDRFIEQFSPFGAVVERVSYEYR